MSIHDDPFTFMVEMVDANDMVMQQLGGAINITAAHAIFDVFDQQYGAHHRLVLRQKARILRRRS